MRKVLLIDDEQDFCFFVKMNLEKTGNYLVEACYDGATGIEKASTLKPDIILLDIMMPGIDGTMVADAIKSKKLTSDIPFIFLTAVVKEDEVNMTSNLIANRWFLSKPVKIQKLISLIENILPADQDIKT